MPSSAGAIVYQVLTTDAGTAPLLGTRVYPEGGVDEGTALPYAFNTDGPDSDDKDVSGVVLRKETEVSVTVVAPTYKECRDLLRLGRLALDALRGVYAGLTVEASQSRDALDTPNQPVERDDQQGYEGIFAAEFVYRE